MDRSQKEACVSTMREELQQAHLVIVARQSGLTVGEVSELRRQMRSSTAHFRVMKNTLARRAVEGTSLEGLTPFLNGPTALAYSVDPIGAAKVLVPFAKSNDKIQIAGGVLDGQVLDKSALQALADLPSLDVLRAQLLGVLTAPATKIARILQEPGSRVARVAAART